MNTEKRYINIRGMKIEINRKNIKNLHIGVYPPDGRVKAAVPLHIDDEALRLAVVSRLPWIKKQRESFEHQERQSKREMISGESHYFMGKRYRLDVVEMEGKQGVTLINNNIKIKVRPDSNRDKKLSILQAWYREQLKQIIDDLRYKWESKLGLKISELRIRKMKTKWGTCNIEKRRIWLNLELAKKPVPCIEYILVHEMIHLLERHHTEKFKKIMDEYMSDWQLRRDKLNSAPLAHEEWQY